MPIVIAEDNHIAELAKLSKADVKDGLRWGNLVDLNTFRDQIDSGFVGSDETALWCCCYDGEYYTGDSVEVNFSNEYANLPKWATHVYWYGK